MPRKSPLRGLKLGLHRLLRRKTTRLDGLTISCDPAFVPRSISTALVKGNYEEPERILVAQAIRKGDKVVEIGTGVGVVSLLCLRLAGPGNVLSYEANATLERAIRANYALNGAEPRLRMKAVTRDGAPVTFYRNENIVSSSVYDRGLSAQEVTVQSDALDRVLAQESATVLVIDVEGAEIGLLASPGVDRLREIVVETHPHIVGEEATQAMVADLARRGFVETGRIHKNLRLTRQG